MAILPDAERLKLRFGPYSSPRVRVGDACACEIWGSVEVVSWTGGPIPWPEGRVKGMRRRAIVCGDLLRALRCETADAIAHHFGFSRTTVWRWRSALGIDSRGVDGYRDVMGQFGDVNGAADWRREHLAEINPHQAWMPDEVSMLGHNTDVAVAAELHRTPSSVKHARHRLGIRRRSSQRPPEPA